jgi:hypothetical protein
MVTAFQFVEETHTYLRGGRIIPSVTQVLQEVGLVDYSHVEPEVLDAKARLGTAVHKAAHYFDEDDLNRESVVSEIVPYLTAWMRFREEARFTPRKCETRGIATIDGMEYGYTFDRDGFLGEKPVLLDIKCTAAVEISWGPQTAAYEHALRQQDGIVRQRAAVHLKPNGTYSLCLFKEARDYQVWKWALALVYWKQSKGK